MAYLFKPKGAVEIIIDARRTAGNLIAEKPCSERARAVVESPAFRVESRERGKEKIRLILCELSRSANTAGIRQEMRMAEKTWVAPRPEDALFLLELLREVGLAPLMANLKLAPRQIIFPHWAMSDALGISDEEETLEDKKMKRQLTGDILQLSFRRSEYILDCFDQETEWEKGVFVALRDITIPHIRAVVVGTVG